METCICHEMGATGLGQRHSLCKAHEPATLEWYDEPLGIMLDTMVLRSRLRGGAMNATATYEEQAAEIGREHGLAAGSWVTDGNSTDADRRAVIQVFEDNEYEIASPLSGEWADGYSILQLFADIGLTDDGLDGGSDLGGGANDAIFEAYEDAYYRAFEEQAVKDALGSLAEDS